MNTKKYDIAAYVWPSYHPDDRAKLFWPAGFGEWETVMKNKPKFEGHEQPRQPLWGYCNEADPYVMDMQIEAAVDHGVNVFIYDWYWYDGLPFLEGCLNDGFLKAKNSSKMKFYLMWANHDVNLTWDIRNAGKGKEPTIWKGSVNRAEFEVIGHRIIEKYFTQPNYYKIDGKPIFMIYDLNKFISGVGGVKEAALAIEWLRKETEKAGFPGLHLQLSLRKRMAKNLSGIDSNDFSGEQLNIASLGFDSTTHYQFVHFLDINRDYSEIMIDAEKEWNLLEKELSLPYFAHVSVGWDNNPRFDHFRWGVVKTNTPAEFEKGLVMAKKYADSKPGQVPLITVNSWNEWTETSYLEPCSMYGYGYLEAVKKVFG